MQRFKKILCVMEHGETSKPALTRAVTLAENNQAELMVVDVVPRLSVGIGMPVSGPANRDYQAELVNEHETRLTALIATYRKRLDIQHKVLVGISFLEVIREVLRNGHDLVIKCPESPAWLNRFLSGDDMHLLRKCPSPVWLVKPDASGPYNRILAAVDVDGSYLPKEMEVRHALNVQILEIAASLALSEFAELHVAYVWKSIYESLHDLAVLPEDAPEQAALNVEQEHRQHQQWLDAFLHNSGNQATQEALNYLKPQTHLIKGSARKEIPILARRLQVDCLVMGTVARTGIRGFLMGNTAETILGQIDCSVLAVKPPGFETPVALDD